MRRGVVAHITTTWPCAAAWHTASTSQPRKGGRPCVCVHVGLPELACSCGHGWPCVAIPDRIWVEAQEQAWKHEQTHVVSCRHMTVCVLPMWKYDGTCACAEGHRQISLGHQAGAERVIREIMQSSSQSRGSASKAMGCESQIGHVLISFVALGNLLNLSLPHFPICKMETIIAPTSEGCWEGSLS